MVSRKQVRFTPSLVPVSRRCYPTLVLSGTIHHYYDYTGTTHSRRRVCRRLTAESRNNPLQFPAQIIVANGYNLIEHELAIYLLVRCYSEIDVAANHKSSSCASPCASSFAISTLLRLNPHGLLMNVSQSQYHSFF